MPGFSDPVVARDIPRFEPDRAVDGETRALTREALRQRAKGADETFVAPDGRVDANVIRHPLHDAARGLSTARLNARWWQGLSDEQRSAVIAAHPDQVGNAEGLPPRVRDEANRRVFKDTRAREAADHLRLVKPIRRLDAVDNALRRAANRSVRMGTAPPLVLAFDPTAFYRDGRIVVAVGGDPYRASSVSWIVPGMTTTMASLDALLNDAANLVESARAEGAADAVSIVWIGYDAPSGWRSARVTARAAAQHGGEILHVDITAFNAGRAAANNNIRFTNNHVFAHSYGSTTTAYAGQGGRLAGQVQTVTLLGSPGAGPMRRADDFGIGPNVFVAGSSRDPVTALGRSPDTTAWVGQGIDPTLRAFGARRLASEFPISMDTVSSAGTHVSYFDYVDAMGPRSQSLTNFGRIAAGRQDQLELHDNRVERPTFLGTRRTVDPVSGPWLTRRWRDPVWASPTGWGGTRAVAEADDSVVQQPERHTHPPSGLAHTAEPSDTPELVFPERITQLSDSEIEIVHARAAAIADQVARRHWSVPGASRLVVHVEAGGNGRRWPLDGWPLNSRARSVGKIRARVTRNALEAEVHRLLDQRGVPRSTVTFRGASRGRGLPDSSGTAHDFESDEVARRVVVIRTEEEAPVSDGQHRIDFAERRKVLKDAKDDLEPFITHVVDEAARRNAAGEAGLIVRVEGGGNSGVPLIGAGMVGKKRARVTRRFVEQEVTSRLRQRGIDPRFVAFSEPASRGRALPDSAPPTGNRPLDKAARRTVVLRLDTATPPSTPHQLDQRASQGSVGDRDHPADPVSSGVEHDKRTTTLEISPSRPTRPTASHRPSGTQPPTITPQSLPSYSQTTPRLKDLVVRIPVTPEEMTTPPYQHLTDYQRTADGELSDGAITHYVAERTALFQRRTAELEHATVTVDGVDDATLRHLLMDDPRYLAEYPELLTYLHRADPTTRSDGGHNIPVRQTVLHAGVRVNFRFAEGDPLAEPRQAQVLRALTTLREGGHELPETLEVHLPRYHRTLVVRAAAAADGRAALDISSSAPNRDGSAGQFVAYFGAPDSMVVSAEAVATHSPDFPGRSADTVPDLLEDVVLGRLLHELMHWLHFQHRPTWFAELENTIFRYVHHVAAGEVSPYSQTYTREFVAEYGVGRLLGRRFDPHTTERLERLYCGLAGPLPDHHTRLTPPPLTHGQLRHLVDAVRRRPGLSEITADEVAAAEATLPTFDRRRRLETRAELIAANLGRPATAGTAPRSGLGPSAQRHPQHIRAAIARSSADGTNTQGPFAVWDAFAADNPEQAREIFDEVSGWLAEDGHVVTEDDVKRSYAELTSHQRGYSAGYVKFALYAKLGGGRPGRVPPHAEDQGDLEPT
ncbi:alpha/beta hydrolase [Mycolicibacterium sp.]